MRETILKLFQSMPAAYRFELGADGRPAEGHRGPCLHKVTEQPFISLRKHKLFVACVKDYAEK